MLTCVFSCAVIGQDGVIVEADFGQGLPHMAIVGLPDAAVPESRGRVFSVVKNAGLIYLRRAKMEKLAPVLVGKKGPTLSRCKS